RMSDWLQALTEAAAQDQPLVMITVVQVEGSGPREPGARMLWYPDGRTVGTIGGGQLEHRAVEDAQAALEESQPRTVLYPLCSRTGQCCGGRVQLLIEPMNAGPRLYVFGAGHVGQAVAKVMQGTAFRVTLIDERPEWIHSDSTPDSVRCWDQGWESFLKQAVWDDERTYAVVMTHDHELDLRILRKLIELPAKYVGLIGSETKWTRFQEKLAFLGAEPSDVERVTCPIGDRSAGKTPAEVAISLGAQILRVHHVKGTSTSESRPTTRFPSRLAPRLEGVSP
ncbi:MAG TPA: xanthine dehydrogenase accessory protein XdhC, partial [Bdellovibrionota bacterium]|nr:xanthine dehydrogenase accessory protein XdhC [Bdellovibrionota bacterium]